MAPSIPSGWASTPLDDEDREWFMNQAGTMRVFPSRTLSTLDDWQGVNKDGLVFFLTHPRTQADNLVRDLTLHDEGKSNDTESKSASDDFMRSLTLLSDFPPQNEFDANSKRALEAKVADWIIKGKEVNQALARELVVNTDDYDVPQLRLAALQRFSQVASSNDVDQLLNEVVPVRLADARAFYTAVVPTSADVAVQTEEAAELVKERIRGTYEDWIVSASNDEQQRERAAVENDRYLASSDPEFQDALLAIFDAHMSPSSTPPNNKNDRSDPDPSKPATGAARAIIDGKADTPDAVLSQLLRLLDYGKLRFREKGSSASDYGVSHQQYTISKMDNKLVSTSEDLYLESCQGSGDGFYEQLVRDHNGRVDCPSVYSRECTPDQDLQIVRCVLNKDRPATKESLRALIDSFLAFFNGTEVQFVFENPVPNYPPLTETLTGDLSRTLSASANNSAPSTSNSDATDAASGNDGDVADGEWDWWIWLIIGAVALLIIISLIAGVIAASRKTAMRRDYEPLRY